MSTYQGIHEHDPLSTDNILKGAICNVFDTTSPSFFY